MQNPDSSRPEHKAPGNPPNLHLSADKHRFQNALEINTFNGKMTTSVLFNLIVFRCEKWMSVGIWLHQSRNKQQPFVSLKKDHFQRGGTGKLWRDWISVSEHFYTTVQHTNSRKMGFNAVIWSNCIITLKCMNAKKGQCKISRIRAFFLFSLGTWISLFLLRCTI